MSRKPLNWRPLALELLVVFVGLFAALQVDSWRDRRALEAAERANLTRLRDDLREFIERTGPLLDEEREWRDAVGHVRRSLVAGEILDGDVERFEEGLLRVAHLPSPALNRSSYNEMVASGLFARLSSVELQRSVSALFAFEEMLENNFSWWRDQPQQLQRDFDPYVDYSGEEPAAHSLFGEATVDGTSGDPTVRVRFDFDGLAADRVVRNGFFWAADTHNDWVAFVEHLMNAAREAEALATRELERGG